jgi:drug/metabolite transporter (DMT)-like permease
MEPSPRERAGRAVAFLALTTLLWGLSFPLIRALSLAQRERAPAMSTWFASSVIVVIRFALGALVIALVSPRSLRGITRSEWTQGLGLGVLCGVGIPWQADGLSHTHASVSAFISQGYCVWIPLVVCATRRRLPSFDRVLSTGLVLAGIVVLSGADLASLRLGRGEVETLIASLFCTAQILWLEQRRFRDNRATTITAIMFVVTALVVTPVALVSGGGLAAWSGLAALPRFAETMLVVTVACTVAPFLLMNRFQKHVAATEAGFIYSAEPLFASGLSLVLPGLLATWMGVRYPNEVAGARLVLGGGMITAANAWAQVRRGV